MTYHISFDLNLKRNPYSGKFIAIEGIDGSGKTTQVERLEKYFKAKGQSIVITKEPTRKGAIGELINRILHSEVNILPHALQYLFVADRIVHYENEVIPALKEGEMIISDRSFWSSVPYGLSDQSILQGDALQDQNRLLTVYGILSTYNQFIAPDYTIYIDTSVDIALKRISEKQGKELYEEKEKLAKITAGYKWLIQKFPEEFIMVDGSKKVEEVNEEILSRLSF